MQYLTYEEYINMGGVLDSAAFQRNISRACGVIDNATRCRMDYMKNIPSQAKACCRDLLEYLHLNHSVEKKVASRTQSAGSVSESETYSLKTADDIYGDIQNILYDYLSCVCDDRGTPLMYRGAMH